MSSNPGSSAAGQPTYSADFSSISCDHCGGPTVAIQHGTTVHYLRYCSDRCAAAHPADDPWGITRTASPNRQGGDE